MTTTRQKVLMLAAILGLSTLCSYELLQGWTWNGLAFGLMAVACAAMFVWQVGEESRSGMTHGVALPAYRWDVPARRILFLAIRRSRGWKWRVKR